MMTIPQALALAVQQHQSGNLPQAEQIYRAILEVEPQQVEALHLLGLMASQLGQYERAIEYLGQAVRWQPDHAEAHYNLGNLLQGQGKPQEAVTCYQRALHLKPDFAQAHNNLGNLLQGQGKLAEAAASYQHALRYQPDYAEAHNNLGNALQRQGKLAEATAHYQHALRYQPDYAEAHYNLGNVLQGQGELAEAVACYQQAVHLKPDFAQAHNNLGNALQRQGRLEEAAASYQQALHCKPDFVKAHNNLGGVLQEQGKLKEAAASYQQALRLQPDFAKAHNNLGTVLKEQGQLPEAVTCYQQALRLQPDYAEAHNNLGAVLYEQGKLPEAVACYQQALRLEPGYAEAQINLAKTYKDQGELAQADAGYQQALRLRPSPRLRIERATLLPPLYASTDEIRVWRAQLQDNLAQLHREHVTLDLTKEAARPLFYLAYQGGNDRAIQRDLARLSVAPPEPSRPLANARRSGEHRIRIGFVSRHFCNHTIGELFRGIIAHLAREDFAVTVFSLGHHHDALAQFIQAHADTYVELPLNLRAARQQLATHPLDVLFYPDIGMDELTYSLAFSRLAPVQCVTWGHPVTTGIPTIDYYLSSELFETPQAEQHYTETLVRLPELPCYCYRVTPPVAFKGRDYFGLPAASHLYACPQSLFKFHPDFDELLGGILRQDPRGLLVLNRPHQASYRHWVEFLERRFAATLADVQDRICFLPNLRHEEYLNLNAISDVMLDTIHFNGGSTSLKALALGVPIVTLPSAYLRGRLTLALYKQMNVLDCVAATPAEYIQLAVRLGTEPDYRAHLRATIRQANGVLYENLAGVRALEGFLRSVSGKSA
jgi:protein O-GlcNAc transferase